MCFLSFFSITEWMLILTTVFTSGLLRVAWLAYKRLIVQKARKKQLEIVVQLVEKLKGLTLNWAKVVIENGEPRLSSLAIHNIFILRQIEKL